MIQTSLYGKTIGLVAAVLVLTVGVLSLMMASIQALQEQREVVELERTLLYANDRVQGFIRTRDLGLAQDANDTLQRLDSLIAVNETLNRRATTREAFVSYQQQFEALTDAIIERGIDEDSGAEGQFRSSVHRVESLISSIQNFELEALMLSARRSEKDYIMRRRVSYVDKVKRAVADIKAAVDRIRPNSAFAREVKREIEAYERDFLRLVTIFERMTRSERALQQAQQSAMAHMDAYISAADKKARRLRQAGYVGLWVALFGGLGFGYLMAKSIVRPVREISQAAKWIASGRTNIEINTTYRNEIGDLAQAFDQVRAHVQEREEAEQALRDSKQFIQTILAHMQEGVVVYDPNLCYILWNSYVETITGRAAQDVYGKSDAEVFPELFNEAHDRILKRALAGETVRTRDLPFVHPHTGVTHWYVATYGPLQQADGGITGVVGNLHEITQQRAAMLALKEAKEAAESAAEAKSRFLATMSHELRTPMNGVIGMASLLQGTPLDEEQQEIVDIIQTSGDTLLHVINDILDFSKIEAGGVALEKRPFLVQEVVEAAIDVVASRASEKHIDVFYSIAQEVPAVVMGDSNRIKQVLLNLLSNAVKFTSAGEVVVRVEPTAMNNLQFSVSDTGIGIPTHKIEQLFEPFRQLDSSTTRKYGGTGLGLSITKRLVDLMEGRLDVSSIVGEGTTFRVEVSLLPVKDNDGSLDGHSPLSGSVGLVVFNDTLRHLLAAHMHRWGMRVVWAISTPERIDSSEDNVDLLIIEEAISTGFGLEGVRRLRERYVNIPIMRLLHAHAPTSATSGVFTLKKPLKYGRLHQVVSEALAWAHKQRARPRNEQAYAVIAEDNRLHRKILARLLDQAGYRSEIAEAPDAFEQALASKPQALAIVGAAKLADSKWHDLIQANNLTESILLLAEEPAKAHVEYTGLFGTSPVVLKLPLRKQALLDGVEEVARRI